MMNASRTRRVRSFVRSSAGTAARPFAAATSVKLSHVVGVMLLLPNHSLGELLLAADQNR